MHLNLSITRSGAYLRGLMLVVQATALPVLVKAASGAQVTRADVLPALIAGFSTGWAYLNQLHVTSPRDKRVIVWLAGIAYVVLAILGSLEKQIVTGAPITSAHAAMALLEGGNALFAYLNKSLSIAKVQDDLEARANLAEPKPTLKEQLTGALRDKAQGFLDATDGKVGGRPNV